MNIGEPGLDLQDILNLRQNQNQNKLVCENAVTKVHRTDRSYSLRVVSSCSQSVCINSFVSGKGAFFISFFQTRISVHPIISANLVSVTSS